MGIKNMNVKANIENEDRVPVQVHCRKMDRLVAHNNMKDLGIRNVNKKKAGESFFQKYWREYVNA